MLTPTRLQLRGGKIATDFESGLPAGVDFRPANFWSDLAHRPAHHRRYRNTWTTLGLDDEQWCLLARRSLGLLKGCIAGILFIYVQRK